MAPTAETAHENSDTGKAAAQTQELNDATMTKFLYAARSHGSWIRDRGESVWIGPPPNSHRGGALNPDHKVSPRSRH